MSRGGAGGVHEPGAPNEQVPADFKAPARLAVFLPRGASEPITRE